MALQRLRELADQTEPLSESRGVLCLLFAHAVAGGDTRLPVANLSAPALSRWTEILNVSKSLHGRYGMVGPAGPVPDVLVRFLDPESGMPGLLASSAIAQVLGLVPMPAPRERDRHGA